VPKRRSSFARGRALGRFCVAILVAALASLLFASAALADDPLAAKELQVERQLGCPICTNLPLNVCDNQICVQMKGVIHDKLAAGETPDEVVAYFVNRYGEGILLTPPEQGFNLAVWYLPVAALALGALVVWMVVRRSLQRQRVVEARLRRSDPALDAYRERVRRDLGVAPDPAERAP
jgi:cytochrome c-type biogenesis protein CcmH